MILLAALLPVYLTHLRLFHTIVMQRERRYQNHIMLDVLSAEVKRAGNTGCAGHVLLLDNRLVIMPTEIIVRHAGSQHATLVNPYDKGLDLTINETLSVTPKDTLIISDCQQAEIFKVSQVGRQNGLQRLSLPLPLHHHFDQGSIVSYLEVNQFMLIQGALYFENIHHSKTKLVDAPPFLHFSLIQEPGGLAQLRITFEKGYYDVTLPT